MVSAKTNTRIAELETQVAELEKKLEASRLAYTKQTSQLLELTRSSREKPEIVDAYVQTQCPIATVSASSQTCVTTSDVSTITEETAIVLSTTKSKPKSVVSTSYHSPDCTGMKTTSFYGSESSTSLDISPQPLMPFDSDAWSYVVVTIDHHSGDYSFQPVSMSSNCLVTPSTPSTEAAPGNNLKFDDANLRDSLTPPFIYEDSLHNELVTAVLAYDLERIRQLSSLYGQQDRSGKTALMYAAELGYADAIPLLAPKEAGMLRSCGRYLLPGTALMHAVVCGHEKCAQLLVNYKGEVGSKTKYGWTALMFATVQNYLNLVQLLAPLETRMVTSSDFLTDQYCNGNTALLMAVKLNHNEIARVLAPYEYDIKDSRGLSADLLSRDSSLRSYLRSLSRPSE